MNIRGAAVGALYISALGLLLLAITGCAQREAYQLLDKAHRLEGAGHVELALEAYLQAVEATPGDAHLQRALGRAYLRRQELVRARGALQEAIRLEPAYLDAYQDLIAVALAQDDVEGALAWLEMAAQSMPKYAPLYERLVAFYLGNERYNDAEDLLDQLAERFPDAAWVPFMRGSLFRGIDQYEAALQAYEEAVQLDEALPDLWAEIGNVHFDLDNFGEAEAAFTRAIEQDPRDHRSMNNLAWTYAVQGLNLDRGIELSRASLELQDQPSYMDTLAELYYKQGDRRRALIWIRRAIRVGTDSEELHDHLQKQLDRVQRAYGRT